MFRWSTCAPCHREQKYLCTGNAASPARAMPTLSPTEAAAMEYSLCLSSVCGREDRLLDVSPSHFFQCG